ncbi:MAG: cupin domain-containing protein [Acidobacteriaceae bacterium]
MNAEDVKRILGLQPHPCEGGWYVRTWEAEEWLGPNAFADQRYQSPRRSSTAIYYLLEARTFSRMHMLKSDEIFHHYMGDAVEVLQLFEDGGSSRMVLGSEIAAGQRPQCVVRRGVWQGCRLLPRPLEPGAEASGIAAGQGWALLGCTVSPGFEFEDYLDGQAESLLRKWPQEAELILTLSKG